MQKQFCCQYTYTTGKFIPGGFYFKLFINIHVFFYKEVLLYREQQAVEA
jgi:hypothetical protein